MYTGSTCEDNSLPIHSRHEPLHPDLHGYLETLGSGTYIRHPFCNEMILDIDRCGSIHQHIDFLVGRSDACFENQDWEGYLQCVAAPHQPVYFEKDQDQFGDEQYWRLLREVYDNQKFTYYQQNRFNRLLRSTRPGRENLMSPEERALLARLPDELTVYRGFSDDGCRTYAKGIAWTLDERQAVSYAMQFPDEGEPEVIRGRIRKQDVWAINGTTLLLPPEKVFGRQTRYAGSEKDVQMMRDRCKAPFDIEKLIQGK